MRTMPDHLLLDTLIVDLKLKNDAALCRFLGVDKSYLSKIRHGKLPVTAECILRVHDMTGWEIKEIKALLPTTSGSANRSADSAESFCKQEAVA